MIVLYAILMQSGTKLRMRGKGILSQQSGSRGDQYVEVQLTLPRSLNERQKALMHDFEKEETQKGGGTSSGGESGRKGWF